MIKVPVFFMILTFAAIAGYAQEAAQKFDRVAFFNTMSAGDVKQINAELTLLGAASFPDKEGFEGALLMRKAGLVTLPKDKLKFFKQGRIKMETALMADSTRTELRFLRLTIEEHAPKIVKYKSDIPRDRLFIQQHYKSLTPVVQKAIIDYSKTSKILRPDDL